MCCCKLTNSPYERSGGQVCEKGLKCTYIGEEQDDRAVKAAVFAGECQLVSVSPESLLCVLQWRKTFRSGQRKQSVDVVAVSSVMGRCDIRCQLMQRYVLCEVATCDVTNAKVLDFEHQTTFPAPLKMAAGSGLGTRLCESCLCPCPLPLLY